MKGLKVVVLVVLLFSLVATETYAQNDNTEYWELPDHKRDSDSEWKSLAEDITIMFASVDKRYAKGKVGISGTAENWKETAWRGEKVHTQFLLRTKKDLKKVKVESTPLVNEKGARIPASEISLGFIRYVLTDQLPEKGSGCGISQAMKLDTSLVADAIDRINFGSVDAYTVQPFWLSVKVPETVPAGIYKGNVKISADGYVKNLPYQIEVKEWTLPEPSQWKFHLDLWQSPYAIARWYGVDPWSDEHMELMRPYMQMLADAGQKAITVSMIYDPWNGQTYDIYGSMIKWTKRKDGSWQYDYTIFDKWVEYMLSFGINRVINCYSMVPWNNKFYYYDEAAGKDMVLEAQTVSPEYAAHWKPMLEDFARHLRRKGWFDITSIAMDERPLKDMQAAINIVKGVDPEYKISLAGNYHEEIEKDIFDYCIALYRDYPDDVLERRTKEGKPTTVYTCCSERRPNTFTFSQPAEAAWLPLYVAAKGYHGYLRWAYNSWPSDPLRDSRYSTWVGGDTYLVYPGVRSSIRYERLIEGIQYFEKIRILTEYFEKTGDKESINKIKGVLEMFDPRKLDTKPEDRMVNEVKKVLNAF